MAFPLQLHIFGRAVLVHGVLELVAYTLGFQLYLLLRRRSGLAAGGTAGGAAGGVPLEKNLWIIVGCVIGAAIGSKILAWAESPLDYWANRDHFAALGGKTIVGGLLGGWAGVEVVKARLGVTQRTGDLFVYPLILGMCIGRIGCFLTGLPDHTYGNHTSVGWAVDFGDGPRHPTQLYEIAFLLLLGAGLGMCQRRPMRSGDLFRLFLLGYLVFRVAVEFIKPTFRPYAGLSAIQVASLAGAALCAWQLVRRRQRGSETPAIETAKAAP